jgi:hypothetical protein
MPHLNGETVSQIPLISKCDTGVLDFSISPRSAAPAGVMPAEKCIKTVKRWCSRSTSPMLNREDTRSAAVKHGYVTKVCDWQHSSFHRFVAKGILSPDWVAMSAN